MKTDESVHIWLCDCGRVHIESRHQRQSFTPAEFLALLSNLARAGGASPSPAQATFPSLAACYSEAARRVARLSTTVVVN